MRDAYLARRGLILDTSLSLSDLGKSAWKGENADTGALAGFLDLCSRGLIPAGSFLLVEHLDRLTRQHIRKALTLFFQILDAGVTIVTLTPEREYSPDMDKDPLSVIEPLILFANANEKSETLSKRLRGVWSEKRKLRKPLTSWTPAWIRLKDDRSGFESVPEKAEVIKKIVRLALDGYGDLRLVKKLNDDKVPVISGHAHWTNAYVSKILRTQALLGHYEPGIEKDGKRVTLGEVWEEYFPAVITKDDWYLLRAARLSRTYQRGPAGTEVANLFTGILFNPRDGQPYQRLIKNHGRLISASYRNGLSGGDTLSLPYKPLEDAFLYALAHDLKLQDQFGSERPVEVDPETTLTAELVDVENRMVVVAGQIKTKPDIMSYLSILADLETRHKEIQKELERHRATKAEKGVEAEVFNDLQALAKMWAGDVEDRTHLRTRIKAKVRQLVGEMWMAVYGKKRSKWKTAVVQMFFKAGGSKVLVVHTEENEIVRFELIHHSETGVAIDERLDFRLYNDPARGKSVRDYDEWQLECYQDPEFQNPRRDDRKPGRTTTAKVIRTASAVGGGG